MLMVLFAVGDVRYAVPSTHVVEVVPFVHLTPIPHAPNYVPGSLNFRGLPVPVVDLCQMIEGRPCEDRLHTRIVILEFEVDDLKQTFGIAAERVTGTSRLDVEAFVDSGVRIADLPFLGGVMTTGTTTRQMLLTQPLLAMLQPVLFAGTNGAKGEGLGDG